MAKKKEIAEDVIVDEVKPDEEMKDAENKDIASNKDLAGVDESTDIEEAEENQEDITEDKPEESKTDEEESPVNDEEEKPEEITLDEVKPDEELPPIDVIDMNNQPINNDAIGDVEVPQGFAPMPKNEKIGTMGNYNGRLYKVINKTHGIWCDNGAAFPLSNLK